LLKLKGDSKMNTRTFTADMLNDPFFIGFDRMVDRMRANTPGQSNYPPYNIVKTDENLYELQLAIAGFTQDDLEIELKEGVLSIEGKKDNADEKNYLHRGISSRAFRRTFTLSDTIVVNGADLTDGILTVELENIIPEEKKPRKITIGRREPELLNG
jgi:molecular chaperone IbpA